MRACVSLALLHVAPRTDMTWCGLALREREGEMGEMGWGHRGEGVGEQGGERVMKMNRAVMVMSRE